MKKVTYLVTIPEVLVNKADNVRGCLESVVKLLFFEWARSDLVEKITVTKPRADKTKVDN